jgi:hypothetical protein
MTVDVSSTGYQMELDAILAVVIGGTSLAGGKFSIVGSTVGALLIATLNKTVLFLGVSAAATPAFKAIVIVALVLLQSERIRSLVLRRGNRTRTPRPPLRVHAVEGGRRMSDASTTRERSARAPGSRGDRHPPAAWSRVWGAASR